MFGTEQQNSINPAVHMAVVPTEIHTQIKITITKKESIKVQHLVFFSATIARSYLCQADKKWSFSRAYVVLVIFLFFISHLNNNKNFCV
jgi:hypothetical protein